MSKRKDPNAVAMGRKGGNARMKTLTPERRSEIARHAVLTRYGKAKAPSKAGPWYGLVAPFPADYRWSGAARLAEILDQVEAKPEPVNLETDPAKPARYWTRDRAEVKARAAEPDLRDREMLVIERPYDPEVLRVNMKFTPDHAAQVKALRGALGEGGRS